MSPGIIRNAIIISIYVILICIKPRRLPYPRYQEPIYGIFPILTASLQHHSITTATHYNPQKTKNPDMPSRI